MHNDPKSLLYMQHHLISMKLPIFIHHIRIQGGHDLSPLPMCFISSNNAATPHLGTEVYFSSLYTNKTATNNRCRRWSSYSQHPPRSHLHLDGRKNIDFCCNIKSTKSIDCVINRHCLLVRVQTVCLRRTCCLFLCGICIYCRTSSLNHHT